MLLQSKLDALFAAGGPGGKATLIHGITFSRGPAVSVDREGACMVGPAAAAHSAAAATAAAAAAASGAAPGGWNTARLMPCSLLATVPAGSGVGDAEQGRQSLEACK